jgi:hypothetical protein
MKPVPPVTKIRMMSVTEWSLELLKTRMFKIAGADHRLRITDPPLKLKHPSECCAAWKDSRKRIEAS